MARVQGPDIRELFFKIREISMLYATSILRIFLDSLGNANELPHGAHNSAAQAACPNTARGSSKNSTEPVRRITLYLHA